MSGDVVEMTRREDRDQRVAVVKAMREKRERLMTELVSSARPKSVESVPKDTKISSDPLNVLLGGGRLVEHPYDFHVLDQLWMYSTVLGPCVSAMARNITGFGYQFVELSSNEDDEVGDLRPDIVSERARLINFFNYAHNDGSFTRLRHMTRQALENTGNAYWEVLRIPTNGKLDSFSYLSPDTVWMSKLDDDHTLMSSRRLVVSESDGKSLSWKLVKEYRRFRKYAQKRGMGVVWFKQFGDSRVLNRETGEYETVENKVPADKRANELLHFKIHSDLTPYGLPRWMGAMLDAFGERAAGEINYLTFGNNNIPSMFIAVSNGQLTEASIDRLVKFQETHIQGNDNYSRFVVVEAESSSEMSGPDTAGNAKIHIERLDQITEEMFQTYTKNRRDFVRQSFRISSVFLGEDEGFSKATASEARRIGDEQVFAPERTDDDDIINRYIMPELGVKYHAFKSNGPNSTNPEDLVRLAQIAEKTGAMTPKASRVILEEALGRKLGKFKQADDFDPDIPFSLTIVRAAKKLSPAPGEPGQNVAPMSGQNSIDRGDQITKIVLEQAVKQITDAYTIEEIMSMIGNIRDDG